MKLTFMGTAGARFMVAKQLAASGGLYLEDGNTRISLDPGPGAIVQYAKRKVDLTKLDAIVISHRHLDHAGDVNVMVEAMTEGGFARRGRLYCPSDALDVDPVVLSYLRRFPFDILKVDKASMVSRCSAVPTCPISAWTMRSGSSARPSRASPSSRTSA